MGAIHLVRHGQASFGAENYDQLSELGYQQARWLGEHFRDRARRFDRLITGTMARHRQTAEALVEGLGQAPEPETHAGFNEYDFSQLLVSYLHHHPQSGTLDPTDAKGIYALLRKAIKAWSRDELSQHLPETWQQFSRRVAAALAHARSDHGENVLVISSGGPISMALKQVLGFDIDALISLSMQCRNTAVSELYFNPRGIHLVGFNHIPHLDQPNRQSAITHY